MKHKINHFKVKNAVASSTWNCHVYLVPKHSSSQKETLISMFVGFKLLKGRGYIRLVHLVPLMPMQMLDWCLLSTWMTFHAHSYLCVSFGCPRISEPGFCDLVIPASVAIVGWVVTGCVWGKIHRYEFWWVPQPMPAGLWLPPARSCFFVSSHRGSWNTWEWQSHWGVTFRGLTSPGHEWQLILLYLLPS